MTYLLFRPIRIGRLELKNRVVMPPMGTRFAEGGKISDRQINYFARRAQGGVGLIINEVTAVDPSGLHSSANTQIFDDDKIPGMKRLTEAVHKYGAKIMLHSCGSTRKIWPDLIEAGVDIYDTVQPEAKERLEALSEVLNSPVAEGFDVLIVGHTDDMRIGKPATRAKHPTNWHLSAHRAIAVEKVLAQAGMTEVRMVVMGMGQFRPIEPNEPKQQGNPKNRRVEIYIVPAGQMGIASPTATL